MCLIFEKIIYPRFIQTDKVGHTASYVILSPHLSRDIGGIEDVQRKLTKFLPGL